MTTTPPMNFVLHGDPESEGTLLAASEGGFGMLNFSHGGFVEYIEVIPKRQGIATALLREFEQRLGRPALLPGKNGNTPEGNAWLRSIRASSPAN